MTNDSSVSEKEESWDLILGAKNRVFDVDVKALWRYRDLLRMFVRRDFVAQYKQTILGPLWMVIQPLLNTLLYYFIFGRIAKIPTGGIAPILFYLSGLVPFSYFSDCLMRTSGTFTSNISLFGKVYFPRLIVPISVTVSSLLKFFIQLLLFVVVAFILHTQGKDIHPGIHLLFLPVALLLLAILGFSSGLLISSLTTKYRDLSFLVSFIVQLLMYGSSVVFSFDAFGPGIKSILRYNPMVWIVEAIRNGLTGVGNFNWMGLAYATVVTIVLFFMAILTFNKVEKNFVDTI